MTEQEDAGLRRDAAENPAAERRPPVIRRLPFRVNPDEGFNEWIVEHLPK